MVGHSKYTGIGVAIVLLLVAIASGWMLARRAVPGSGDMREHLRDRGRVLCVCGDDLGRLSAHGTTLVDVADLSGIGALLDATDERALTSALARSHIAHVLIDTAQPLRGRSVIARLSRLERVSGFVGVYLAPSLSLYAVRPWFTLDEARFGDALATVARRVLMGDVPPQPSSFPEQLRSERVVEVMVRVSDGDRPRMWRSARGSSIANALLVATHAIFDRWREREHAMQESLSHALARMNVEVLLLEEDGAFDEPTAAAIDRAITLEHGVGYTFRDAWEYALPAQVRVDGSGSKALHALFAAHSLPDTAIARDDLRVYRFSVTLLGRSLAPVSLAGAGEDSRAGIASWRAVTGP
ncbi:MAG: hypothetical protein IPK60_22520 [Sandaracinaceae bacterium]|nr:hypothetical protein [Sandaracinaceae bacterium]